MSSRTSDVTSLTTEATDSDDKNLSTNVAATAAVTTNPVTLSVESGVDTANSTISAIGVEIP